MSIFEEITKSQQANSAVSGKVDQGPAGLNPQEHPILRLQRTIGNRAVGRLLEQNAARSHTAEQQADAVAVEELPMPEARASGPGIVQRKCSCGGPASAGGDCEECKRKNVARRASSSSPSRAQRSIQRQTDDDTPTAPAQQSDPAAQAATPGLIVDDSVQELGPGQMAKSAFLSALRPAVYGAVDQAVSGGPSAAAHQRLDGLFGRAEGSNGQQIESGIRQFAPEASAVTSAADYIPILAEHAGNAAQSPEEGNGSGSAEGSGGGGPAVAMKARDGGPTDAGSPQMLRAELGSGQPLNQGVGSRMETAFGLNFAHVRLHTDDKAAQLSKQLNARAFTVGEHVAFGAGEYRPGTAVGDTLLAHELAHVAQQTSADGASSSEGAYRAMEEDADRSAGAVMAHLSGRVVTRYSSVWPRLKSSLSLQRSPDDVTVTYKFQGKSGFNVCIYCACDPALPHQKWVEKDPRDVCPPGKEIIWRTGSCGDTPRAEKFLDQNPCHDSTNSCL